jgi:hypothetical protein
LIFGRVSYAKYLPCIDQEYDMTTSYKKSWLVTADEQCRYSCYDRKYEYGQIDILFISGWYPYDA